MNLELKITLDNKKEIVLTEEEAKELKGKLDYLFGTTKEYIPYTPYVPIYPQPLVWWYDDNTKWLV